MLYVGYKLTRTAVVIACNTTDYKWARAVRFSRIVTTSRTALCSTTTRPTA